MGAMIKTILRNKLRAPFIVSNFVLLVVNCCLMYNVKNKIEIYLLAVNFCLHRFLAQLRAFGSAELILSNLIWHPLSVSISKSQTVSTGHQKLYSCIVSSHTTLTWHAYNQVNMTFTVDFMGQSLLFPCIPMENVILPYA